MNFLLSSFQVHEHKQLLQKFMNYEIMKMKAHELC